MDSVAFYRKLEELLDMAPGILNGREPLSSLDAWDSLAVLGFISLADREYGLAIPPASIPTCRTVDDLAGLLSESSKVSSHEQSA
jgi:acyl carrier protein